jgi:hypothetical protein
MDRSTRCRWSMVPGEAYVVAADSETDREKAKKSEERPGSLWIENKEMDVGIFKQNGEVQREMQRLDTRGISESNKRYVQIRADVRPFNKGRFRSKHDIAVG